ncbi:MAG: NYN domain-containing protein, partial [Salinibacterium sp.]
DALGTISNLSIFEGKYKPKSHTCRGCGLFSETPNEKMTDVNIAAEMLMDAFDDLFDTAFLISGDSDLVPPVRHVLKRFPDKRIVAIFPPKRISKEMRSIASTSLHVRPAELRRCQFPDRIERNPAPPLFRPLRWR